MVSKLNNFDSHSVLALALPRIKDELQEILGGVLHRNEVSGLVKQRVQEYYKQCIDYNLVGGKLTRARTVCEAVGFCRGEETLSESSPEIQAAIVFGWAVEILQSFFLIEDDVMDNGEQRRGQPCWYRTGRVGIANAINDGLLLEQLLYTLIEQNSFTKPFAIQAHSLFRNAAMRTVIGQHLDTFPPVCIDDFTRDQWLSVVRYKTAFYTFILPCELGILVSGKQYSANDLQLLHSIGLLIGELFQAQDDMLDCFGDPTVIGKVGRDIEEGKCTWLLYFAIEMADEAVDVEGNSSAGVSLLVGELKALYLKAHSGPAIVERVKEIYRALDLCGKFDVYVSNLNGEISGSISQLESEELQALCRWLHATTHKREK